jgi:hypothetical protein
VAQGDERIAVLAHRLLNPMTAVIAGIDAALRLGGVSPEGESALLASKRQAQAVCDHLRELVQGRAPEVLSGPGTTEPGVDLKQA